MSMCDHLQEALKQARDKGNWELAGTIEKALAQAGCSGAALESGGTGRPPPGP
jgi:hypothetical protein